MLMSVGALVGLGLVAFGAYLLIRKLQGDFEISLKIGSLKTGSAGMAVIALGLIFFLTCALSLKTAADSSQALSQQEGVIAQHETATQTVIDQLAGALSGQSDETKNAILAILLKSEDAAEPAAAAKAEAAPSTAGPPAAHPPAGAPASAGAVAPAPAASTPAYHALAATFITALAHTVTPESLARMKAANPRLQQHLAAPAPAAAAPAAGHAPPH
jgi:hypothetical protein